MNDKASLKKLFHHILIVIDVSFRNNIRGPGSFINGIKEILPFFWGKCSFISSLSIFDYLTPDIYFIPYPRFNEKKFNYFIENGLINKLILDGTLFLIREFGWKKDFQKF